MSIIVSAPIVGSLKINNSSASPLSMYLCNLKTVTVNGDFSSGMVNILNQNGQPLIQLPLNKLTTVGASGAGSFTMQNAVDAISSLIITA